MRTLLLDSTFFPVRVVGWQKAMILLLSGRAEVVDEYSEIPIRSISQSFNLPKVLRLFNRHKSEKKVRFTRQNVFWRDAWTCQYCAVRFPAKELTFDHVIPRAKNGETSWENVVTACRACNIKKAAKTLQEANMKLIKPAQKPRWTPVICLRLKEDDPEEWTQWFPSLSTLKAEGI